MREQIIKAGVSNLKRFGYKSVNAENITSGVYGQFFKSMLEENKGASPKADVVIDELLAEIESKSKGETK